MICEETALTKINIDIDLNEVIFIKTERKVAPIELVQNLSVQNML